MNLRVPAIVCAVRTHGETGAVVRLLTEQHGLLAGYVRGGRSRRLRPVLMPGNEVVGELRARVETQLPALTVELTASRAALLGEPLSAAAIEWATALAAAALPEAHPYARVYQALDGLLTAVALSPAARAWAGGLVGYERTVLAELGFGLEPAEGERLFEALRSNGDRLAGDLLQGRAADILNARDRLVTRLRRALLPA